MTIPTARAARDISRDLLSLLIHRLVINPNLPPPAKPHRIDVVAGYEALQGTTNQIAGARRLATHMGDMDAARMLLDVESKLDDLSLRLGDGNDILPDLGHLLRKVQGGEA